MAEVSLTIDGREVKAEKGTNLLEAAQNAGFDIPHLCYHPMLAPYGACRLCMVEIERGKRTRLVSSCVYPVEDGLTVHTESDRVVKGRKMLLEFLWARAPGCKAIRDYGTRYGISGMESLREFGEAYGAGASKTKFEIEPTFCVLCGLCVRYCAEIKKKNAIGFIGRGTEREVMFFPEIAREECPQCEECFSVCPTGLVRLMFDLVKEPQSL